MQDRANSGRTGDIVGKDKETVFPWDDAEAEALAEAKERGILVRWSYRSQYTAPVEDVVLGFCSLAPGPGPSATIARLACPVTPYDRCLAFLNERTRGPFSVLWQGSQDVGAYRQVIVSWLT